MNDDRANKYADLYFDATQEGTPDQRRRILLLLIKTVERDTRHQAAREVQTCINRVHNLEYDSNPT